MDPHRSPPVLDMTPEGEFRDPMKRPATGFDRLLARLGASAMLIAVGAGAVVLAGLALVFAALAIPVLLVAGAIGAGSIWWRLRRMRRNGQAVRFVVIQR
ncbi:hypothetical protein [Falsiroseomonas sp. HW251]|uniref:hypothetical protein n=1 Tax=Falsiroseomonas sp. HW251 TaxID=3390998 RepID=UPI003D31523B